MATNSHALSVQNVQELTNVLAPDLIESPALLNASIFEKLSIKVLTGTEFQRTQMLFRRKAGEARQYKEGSTIKSKLGYIEERKLEVKQAWARYYENLQKFREKEPFSILGSNQSYNAPVSEMIIRNIGKQYSEDVLNNMFFGKFANGSESPMGLYDGYWTQIDREINSGMISTANMNYVTTEPIVNQPSASVGETYGTFVKWVESWHPALRDAESVIVYCSPECKRLIVSDYMKVYTGFQKESNASNAFRLFDMPNIQLVSHAAMGRGDRMIATVPLNLEFGLDNENDWNSVSMDHAEDDHNILIFQIQSTQGVRILDTSARKFCVNSGTNVQIEGLVGDYQKNSLTVITNDKTMGTVTVSPVKTEYTEGESITMTPVAKSDHAFVKWSDNAISNPRTIIYSGSPENYEAIFEKTSV